MVGRAPFRAPRGCVRGVPRRRGLAPSEAMASTERVCPYCGEPPGPGVFCAACGRNLAAVERLPTRAEWEAGASAAPGARRGPAAGRGARALAGRGDRRVPRRDARGRQPRDDEAADARRPQGGPPAPHAGGGGMGRAAGRLGRPRRPEAPSARAPPDDRWGLPPHRQPDPRLGAAQLPGLLRHRGRRRRSTRRTTAGSPPTSTPCCASTTPRRAARSPRGGSATPGR